MLKPDGYIYERVLKMNNLLPLAKIFVPFTLLMPMRESKPGLIPNKETLGTRSS